MDTISGFNIFLHLPEKRRYVLYRSGSVRFTEEHKDKLSENRMTNIFIKGSERRPYTRYLEKHLTEIIADDAIPIEKKSEMVYQCSTGLLQDVFQRTGLAKNIPRVSKMVKNTVEHLYRGTGAFISMLDVMSHDYYTFSHSMNVCVIGAALGQSVGFKVGEVNELGAGLLLHDLGKSQIDESILNKKGPLNEEEWKIIRQHPEVGARIAAKTHRVAPVSLQVIRQQ